MCLNTYLANLNGPLSLGLISLLWEQKLLTFYIWESQVDLLLTNFLLPSPIVRNV